VIFLRMELLGCRKQFNLIFQGSHTHTQRATHTGTLTPRQLNVHINRICRGCQKRFVLIFVFVFARKQKIFSFFSSASSLKYICGCVCVCVCQDFFVLVFAGRKRTKRKVTLLSALFNAAKTHSHTHTHTW